MNHFFTKFCLHFCHLLFILNLSAQEEIQYPQHLSVCKLVAGRYLKHNTPIDRHNRPIGKTFVEEKKDMVFCSGTLVDGGYILTAAHCFQGNLEQYIRRESVLVPKEIRRRENGKEIVLRPKGCDRADWANYPKCIKGKLRLQVQVKLEEVRAECTDGVSERVHFSLEEKNGYPHPFYFHENVHSKSYNEFGSVMAYEMRMRKNANDHDIALWKTSDWQGLQSSIPVKRFYQREFDLNPEYIFINNPRSIMCYSYGFGYNKLVTPAVSLYRKLTMSLFDSRENIILTKGDSLRNGDSGGPLICKNRQGRDEIVGVNSRILTQGGMFLYNEFSTTFYNDDWLQFVRERSRPHETTDDWHKLVLPYEYNKVSQMMAEAKKCKYDKRKEASRDGYKLLLNSYKTLGKKYKQIKKVYRKRSEKDVFIRGDLKQLRKELNDFLLNCQFSMRGF